MQLAANIFPPQSSCSHLTPAAATGQLINWELFNGSGGHEFPSMGKKGNRHRGVGRACGAHWPCVPRAESRLHGRGPSITFSHPQTGDSLPPHDSITLLPLITGLRYHSGHVRSRCSSTNTIIRIFSLACAYVVSPCLPPMMAFVPATWH